MVPLLVLLFHSNFITVQYFYFSLIDISAFSRSGGVDYFFVLSGFMIYYIHHKDIGKIEKLKFYLIKRLIRIYPLYWFITILIICISFLFPSLRGDMEWDARYIISSLLLLPQQKDPIVGVAWSLSHTLLFYFVFAFMLVSKSLSAILYFTFGTLIIIFTLGWIRIESVWVNFFFNILNLEFFMGCFSAFLVLNYKIAHEKWLIIIGGLLFLGTWLNFIYNYITIDPFFSYSVASVCLIIGLVALDFANNIRIPKGIIYLGNASYSIYLTHYGILNLVAKSLVYFRVVQYIGGFFSIFICIALAVIGGCLIHSYIDKPLIMLLKLKLLKNTK